MSSQEKLKNFLVPADKRVLEITDPSFKPAKPAEIFDYIVVSDALGRVVDVQDFLTALRPGLAPTGRLVLIHRRRLRRNWLAPIDLKNLMVLAGFETVKTGWRFGGIQYLVARLAGEKPVLVNPSISIIVPARNEAGTIEKIARELPALGAFTEIIFVEGNSTDNTLAEIKRVVSEVKTDKRLSFAVQGGRGKGDAVRKGFDLATGDILAIYDADMTVPPEEVVKFYRALVENRGDFINGSRLVYPMEKQSMRRLNFLGNKFFSLAFSWILGQPLKDTLCGTKVLWTKDYEAIKRGRSFFGDFDPFGDFDLLFGAAKLNLKIIDLPIHYKDRIYGETNISRWSHGWLLLKMVVFAARKLKFL